MCVKNVRSKGRNVRQKRALSVRRRTSVEEGPGSRGPGRRPPRPGSQSERPIALGKTVLPARSRVLLRLDDGSTSCGGEWRAPGRSLGRAASPHLSLNAGSALTD
jgi:hypothetical protein